METRSMTSRNALVERYIPLVRRAAQKVAARMPGNVQRDELESAGIVGLMEAIKKYRLDHGASFETYCSARIRGAMLDELRAQDWTPRALRIKLGRVRRARDRLAGELGRLPREDELAQELELSLREVRRLLWAQSVGMVPLELCGADEGDSRGSREMKALADQKGPDPAQGVQERELLAAIGHGLSQTEQLIVTLYYYEQFTMKQIGEVLELTESRVSQLHSQVVVRLKKKLG